MQLRPNMMGLPPPGGGPRLPMGVGPPPPAPPAPPGNDLDSLLTHKSMRDRLKTEK